MALADAGAIVTLMARTESELADARDAIRANGGDAIVKPCDVTDDDAVAEALASEPAHDIVVNAAGGNRPQPLEEIEMATFDALFALNVRGTFSVTRHAVRRLRDEDRTGVVINVSSQMGHVGAVNCSVYCATKHAVEGLTKSLGIELAPHGIRVVVDRADLRGHADDAPVLRGRRVPRPGHGLDPDGPTRDGRRRRCGSGLPRRRWCRDDHRDEHPRRRRLDRAIGIAPSSKRCTRISPDVVTTEC